MEKLILILAFGFLSAGLFAQGENLGIINGLTQIDSTDAADITLSESDCNNGLIFIYGSGTKIVRLPSARTGLSVGFLIATTVTLTIIPTAGDYIDLEGTDLGVLDTVDSSGAKGEAITLVALSPTHWASYGTIGTWTDAGPE